MLSKSENYTNGESGVETVDSKFFDIAYHSIGSMNWSGNHYEIESDSENSVNSGWGFKVIWPEFHYFVAISIWEHLSEFLQP